MLAGHLAVALGAKKADAGLPLWALVGAAFWLDLLWPLLLVLGIEEVRVQPGDTAFTNLTFVSYPWTHSLVMAAAWSLGAFALATFAGWSRVRGAILGALVFSHWVLDFVTHRPDLPLWPGGPVVGLGLWNSVAGTLVVEGGLYAAALGLYLAGSRSRDGIGRYALWGLIALIGLIWATQPWSPPPPSSPAVAWGALILWLLLPWAAWIDRHRATTN